MSEVRNFFFPPADTLCTKTFWIFLEDYKEVIDYFFFNVNLAHGAEKAAKTAASALIDFYEPETDDHKKYLAVISSPSPAVERLKKFGQLQSKYIAVNMADGFLWYISNAVQEAIKRRPEVIKSGESIKVEEIFDYPSRRELINYLIDRKLNALSYGGLKQIEKFVEDALGLSMFASESDRSILRILIEVRNIHAHNRGIVNRIFLDRVGKISPSAGFNFKEGRKAHMDFDELCIFSAAQVQTALHFDRCLAAKFSIGRRRIKTWRNGLSST